MSDAEEVKFIKVQVGEGGVIYNSRGTPIGKLFNDLPLDPEDLITDRSCKEPESYSLEMYTSLDEIPSQDSNTYWGMGPSAVDAMRNIAWHVDDVEEWDFSKLMGMGLSASVVALGKNPEGAEMVWVKLTIE